MRPPPKQVGQVSEHNGGTLNDRSDEVVASDTGATQDGPSAPRGEHAPEDREDSGDMMGTKEGSKLDRPNVSSDAVDRGECTPEDRRNMGDAVDTHEASKHDEPQESSGVSTTHSTASHVAEPEAANHPENDHNDVDGYLSDEDPADAAVRRLSSYMDSYDQDTSTRRVRIGSHVPEYTRPFARERMYEDPSDDEYDVLSTGEYTDRFAASDEDDDDAPVSRAYSSDDDEEVYGSENKSDSEDEYGSESNDEDVESGDEYSSESNDEDAGSEEQYGSESNDEDTESGGEYSSDSNDEVEYGSDEDLNRMTDNTKNSDIDSDTEDSEPSGDEDTSDYDSESGDSEFSEDGEHASEQVYYSDNNNGARKRADRGHITARHAGFTGVTPDAKSNATQGIRSSTGTGTSRTKRPQTQATALKRTSRVHSEISPTDSQRKPQSVPTSTPKQSTSGTAPAMDDSGSERVMRVSDAFRSVFENS